MVFLLRVPLVRHAGHVGFRGCYPEHLTVVPHTPFFPAQRSALRIVAWHLVGTMGATLVPVLVAGGMGAAEPPAPPAALVLTKPPCAPVGAWLRRGPP